MGHTTEARLALSKLLAMLFALAVIAAACGDADDDAAPGAGEDADGETATPTTVSPEAPEDGEAAGEPVRGGRLVYAIEADSANPWAHYRTSCAISCYVILQTIADPLLYPNTDAVPQPYLLESIEPNDDFTEWTMTLRDGIEFHDGTPLDAEAVKFNIESCVGSSLTGPAYTNIGEITVQDPLTLTVGTAQSPWVALPTYFSSGQCSYMFSPEWLQTLPDIPHRISGNRFFDEGLAAIAADGDPAAPVGTGPFVYQSYTPGNGNSFLATRNDNYWRGENGITGEGLPYLDEVEAVVAVDIQSRSAGVRSGQFNVIHTANADEIVQFQGDDAFDITTSNQFGETSYILLNTAQGENLMTGAPIDPNNENDDNPLINVHCRRALAHAIDRDRIVEERGGGIVEPANGPFPPGSLGYLDDSGYPAYDPDAALAEMDICLQEWGSDTIEFDFNTTNDPFNVETNQLIVSMWNEVFGDTVNASITPIEQGQYIGLALTGDFEAQGWRNHGGIDPDQQLLWWISATASPIGELALNFGRFSDGVIDENLLTIRTNPDPDARREAAEAVNRRFGEQVYNFWTSWTLWGVISDPSVQDVVDFQLPNGETGLPVLSGRHPVAQIWCTDGTCGS